MAYSILLAIRQTLFPPIYPVVPAYERVQRAVITRARGGEPGDEVNA